jgi:endonuclease YncB( thermonuclease family)
MKKLSLHFLCLCALLFPASASAWELKGTVTKVIDGDTVWIDNETKIRFNWIDAPELKQEHGKESKEFLSAMIMGKDITAICGAKDTYGRPVCIVMHDNINVNKKMVSTGNAWSYKNYSTSEVALLEVDAKINKVGLWKNNNPCAPWDFRKKRCK